MGAQALPYVFNMYGLGNPFPLTAGVSFGYIAPLISSISPTSGFTQGGTLITVSGTNFGDGTDSNIVTKVTLDGRACTLDTTVPFTSSSIVFMLPSYQGQGLDVIVTVGGQVSNAAQFNYFPPQIFSVSPAVGIIGQNLTLTGTSFGRKNGQVTVGNIDCPVLLQTDNVVVCQIPPGQGTINSIRFILDVTTFSQGSSLISLTCRQ